MVGLISFYIFMTYAVVLKYGCSETVILMSALSNLEFRVIQVLVISL